MSTEGADHDERLFTGYTGRLSVLLAVSWFVILAGRYAVPAVLPQISADLALSPSQSGFALTLMWGFYAIAQYPGGHLADQLSRKTVLVGSFLTLIVGFVWLAVIRSYLGFLLTLSLIGTGAALFFTPSRALISDLFSERRGTVMSVQVAAGRAGSAASGPIAAVAVAVAAWQTTFLPVVVLLVVVLVFMHRYNREPYVIEAVSLDVQGTIRRVLLAERARLVLLAYTLVVFSTQAFTSFLPTLLQTEKGFSAGVASLAFTSLFVVGIVSSLIGGNLGDRFSRPGVATVALFLGAAGIGVLLWAPTRLTVVVGIVIHGAGLWAFPPVMQAHLMDILSAKNLGNDFGAVKTIYTGLASVGPAYVGFVAERASYSLAFAGLILVLGLAAVLLGWLVLTD